MNKISATIDKVSSNIDCTGYSHFTLTIRNKMVVCMIFSRVAAVANVVLTGVSVVGAGQMGSDANGVRRI